MVIPEKFVDTLFISTHESILTQQTITITQPFSIKTKIVLYRILTQPVLTSVVETFAKAFAV